MGEAVSAVKNLYRIPVPDEANCTTAEEQSRYLVLNRDNLINALVEPMQAFEEAESGQVYVSVVDWWIDVDTKMVMGFLPAPNIRLAVMVEIGEN